MPKLTKTANCLVQTYVCTDEQTDPNFRKALRLKSINK